MCRFFAAGVLGSRIKSGMTKGGGLDPVRAIAFLGTAIAGEPTWPDA
jgi:hypothetical protein